MGENSLTQMLTVPQDRQEAPGAAALTNPGEHRVVELVVALPGRPRFDVTFSQPPVWLNHVSHRLNELASMTGSWDGRGAQSLATDALLMLLHALQRTLNSSTPEPQFVLSPDGGLQVEWHQGGWDIEIEARPNGDIEGMGRHAERRISLWADSLLGLDQLTPALRDIES